MLDQLAMALANALAKLIGQQQIGLNTSDVKADLKIELDLDLDFLIHLSDEELITTLKNKRFNNPVIELLSKLFFEIGKNEISLIQKKETLKKSILFIHYLNKTDKTYSVERQNLLNSMNII